MLIEHFPASSGFHNQFLFCFKTFLSTFQSNQFLDQNPAASCKLYNREYNLEREHFLESKFCYRQNRESTMVLSARRDYPTAKQVAIRQTGFSSLITHRPSEPDASSGEATVTNLVSRCYLKVG